MEIYIAFIIKKKKMSENGEINVKTNCLLCLTKTQPHCFEIEPAALKVLLMIVI